MQLQREIDELKKDERSIEQIQLKVKEKERLIMEIEEEKWNEEKQQKLIRERTLSELASLNTKVVSRKKRLQELEIVYGASLVDLE